MSNNKDHLVGQLTTPQPPRHLVFAKYSSFKRGVRRQFFLTKYQIESIEYISFSPGVRSQLFSNKMQFFKCFQLSADEDCAAGQAVKYYPLAKPTQNHTKVREHL